MNDAIGAKPEAAERGAIPTLAVRIQQFEPYAARATVSPLIARQLANQVYRQLCLLYGADSEAAKRWPRLEVLPKPNEARDALLTQLAMAKQLLKSLQAAPAKVCMAEERKRVFIGHGRSAVWRQLKDFLKDDLRLDCVEFKEEPVAGISTSARLQKMLDDCTFAFLVMTAEDDDGDGRRHARRNVIHEVGLFQGRLGPERAIIFLEHGCEVPTNLSGLTYIPFPTNDVSAGFQEARRALAREGIISPAQR